MPAKSETPLTRLCLRLRSDDLEVLENMGAASGTNLNLLVREIVHKFVINLQDFRRRSLDQQAAGK
jgi:predicted DNA binding CopG/RHH family protein